MNIELSNSLKPVTVPKRAADPAGVPVPSTAAETAGAGGESLSVSLLPLFEEVRQAPEVDAARVADIKARLERGEYTVDAARVARKMVEQEAVFEAAG